MRAALEIAPFAAVAEDVNPIAAGRHLELEHPHIGRVIDLARRVGTIALAMCDVDSELPVTADLGAENLDESFERPRERTARWLELHVEHFGPSPTHRTHRRRLL